MTITLGRQQAIKLLQRAVAEKGEDYIYKKPGPVGSDCTYTTPDGAPSCIVGYVLGYLDPAFLEQINQMEWEYSDPVTASVASMVSVFDLDLHLSFEALCVLASVQNLQDAGLIWGQAVARSIRANPESES